MKKINFYLYPQNIDTSATKSIDSISNTTNNKLFDLTKPIPNEVIEYSLGTVFFISVLLAVWIHILWKKRQNLSK